MHLQQPGETLFGWHSLRSPKTGLLCEGGGQLAVYGVGALQCFHDYGVTFPYYIGVSAAAANLVSHLAGHRERTLRFYADYAQRKEYMGLWLWLRQGSFVDLNYVYGPLCNEEDPLAYDVLNACEDELRVVVTNASSGQAEYLDNSAFRQRQCQALMASCCLPIYCRPVALEDQLYFDGGVADSIPVQQALRDGCEQIVAILNRPPGYQKAPEKGQLFYPVALRKYPGIAKALRNRHAHYMEALQTLECMEAEGKAVLIRPAQPLPMHTFTRKPRALLEEVCRMGYEDAQRALLR